MGQSYTGLLPTNTSRQNMLSVVAAAALLAVCSAAPQYYYPPYAMYAAPYPAMYPYQGYPVYGAVSPDTASSRLLTFSSLMSVTGKMEATGTYTVSGTAEFQQNPLTGNNSKYSFYVKGTSTTVNVDGSGSKVMAKGMFVSIINS